MPSIVLKLFAGQGTGRTYGQSDDYMLPPLGSINNTGKRDETHLDSKPL